MFAADQSLIGNDRYRPDIDGLRAVAVLAVMGYHFFPRLFPGGFVGVDIFFVISGFLISGIILDDLDENKFSFPKFYARRVRRLFPALALVLAFTLAIGYLVLFPVEFKALGKHAFGGAAFISNILYWRESGYFDAEATSKPLLHLWSLGIEEQFYILFPWLFCWVWKRGFRESLVIILLLSVSLTYNRHLQHIGHAAADFYSPAARFWELLTGAILAALSRAPADSPPRRAARKINALLAWMLYKRPKPPGSDFRHLLSVLGLIITALAIFTFRARPDWPGHWAVTPVAGAALVIAAGRGGFFNHRILANRLAVAIGLISYPLYLWHWPLLAYLRILNGGSPDRYSRVLAALAALALAGLSYILVERPLRFGPRFRVQKTILLGGLLAFAAGAGLFLYVREGLPERRFRESLDYTTTATRDESCPAYIGIEKSFGYCRFSGGHGSTTVALIGNSHAWSAYFGVEKYNSTARLNTLLLGTPTLPLLIGTEAEEENKDRNEFLLHSFKVLLNRAEIKHIFIIIRALRTLEAQAYLQPTIDKLTEAGKNVFLVVDWPFLARRGVDYITRPYSELVTPPATTAERRRELDRNRLAATGLGKIKGIEVNWLDYLQVIRALKNVTLIESWDAFCPGRECLVFSEVGKLLYTDQNHLTDAGSEFLADKILKPYLDTLKGPVQED